MSTPRRSSIVLAPSSDSTAMAVAPRTAAATEQLIARELRDRAPVPADVALDPRIVAGLVALARLFAPFVAAELGHARGAANASDAEGWLDQSSSPLGRRTHCALARRGVLPARKVGRRWLVRKTDLEAFIAEHGRAPDAPADPEAEALDEDAAVRAIAAECGMELAAPVRAGLAKKARR